MPSPAGPITGPATICANSAGVVYSVGTIPNATSYQWTLPAGASITAGSGTNIITVTFGSTSGPVTVAGTGTCSAGTSAITGTWATTGAKTVSVNYTNASNCTAIARHLIGECNALPAPTITGNASVCQYKRALFIRPKRDDQLCVVGFRGGRDRGNTPTSFR